MRGKGCATITLLKFCSYSILLIRRLNDQIEGPASKKSKLEHEQSRILSSIKLRVDNSGSRILNLESLRIAESSGIGTENEEADGSNNEMDLRQFIKSRYVLHYYKSVFHSKHLLNSPISL